MRVATLVGPAVKLRFVPTNSIKVSVHSRKRLEESTNLVFQLFFSGDFLQQFFALAFNYFN